MTETLSGSAQGSQEPGIQDVPGTVGTGQAHTPGPWECVVISRTESRVRSDEWGRIVTLIDPNPHLYPGMNEANAHLIAAAPDQNAVLVALTAYDKWCRNANTLTAKALREALDALGLHGSLAACWAGIVLRAEGAIAKAEGRQ